MNLSQDTGTRTSASCLAYRLKPCRKLLTMVSFAAPARAFRSSSSIVDQQAALFGHGCQNTGDAKITFGTGAFVLAISGARSCVR